MSVNQPALAEPKPRFGGSRFKWIAWGAALVVGLGVGVGLAVLPSSHSAAPAITSAAMQTWAAGEQPAPAFTLTDQHGKPVTLSSYRGRPVIVTFIDPLCRDFCPREATVLTQAAAQLGRGGPAIVSVSVDPWGDSPANFRADALHWRLAPGWRWGTGSYAQLASVWKSYYVGVQVANAKIAGVHVRRITHTGAAYLIDGTGHERALFLYPFTTSDVVNAARKLLAG
ncbi:MAG TPA: SCO family protein [Gaiellaceae bacterium]|jgi:cytochrome oxidase Cu insertion factor (SCO1/SenC/PrrC family)|nr:SCO family protein [Gaiellaceae bacterium]